MRVLFLHQNFPGQFKHLAPALAAQGHEVIAIHNRTGAPGQWNGVRLVAYRASRGSSPDIHPWVQDLEAKTIRGEAAFRVMIELRARGWFPDVVVAHPGWGESLFVKDVWPRVRLGIYCEFFFRDFGVDTGLDLEFGKEDPTDVCRLRLKNLGLALNFESADAGIAPTLWQASTFPDPFRRRITVVHDGIDTGALVPNAAAGLALTPRAGGRYELTRASEVITFVNRNLEPARGFHVFMRALPEILRRRPHARVMIVGGSEATYSAPAPGGSTWKDLFIEEVRPRISDADWARVHFLGKVSYDRFVRLLQVATVHVYLTYPFVLSWSLLEAMSVGAAIVASDTAPVREVMRHDETGRLTGFFDVRALVDEVCGLLDDPAARARLGASARAFVQAHYDLKNVCLPKQLEWLRMLARGGG
jgi:glycosyltransferase involved in cell wall biosynthesis